MKITIAAVLITAHTVAVCGRIIFVGNGCARPEEVIDGMAEQNTQYWSSMSKSARRSRISNSTYKPTHKAKRSKPKPTKTSEAYNTHSENINNNEYSQTVTCTEIVPVACAPCGPCNPCNVYNPCNPCNKYNPCNPCNTYNPCNPCVACAPCVPFPCIIQPGCQPSKTCKDSCDSDSVSVVITAAVALPSQTSCAPCTTALITMCAPLYYCTATLGCCNPVCQPCCAYPQGGCNYPQTYCGSNNGGCYSTAHCGYGNGYGNGNGGCNNGGYSSNGYQGYSGYNSYEGHPGYGYEGAHCSSSYYQAGPVQSVYDPHTAYEGAPYYTAAPYAPAPYAPAPYAAAPYAAAPYAATPYSGDHYSSAYTNESYSTGYGSTGYSAPYSSSYEAAPYTSQYAASTYGPVYPTSSAYHSEAPQPAPTASYQTGCTRPACSNAALACGSGTEEETSSAYEATQAYEDIAQEGTTYSAEDYVSATDPVYSDNAKERKK
ncbi:hypothetical protein J3B02_003049 [Coemansia erecta]|nr:hypothetical protein J3B02_003049 [Coemansia erecta]